MNIHAGMLYINTDHIMLYLLTFIYFINHDFITRNFKLLREKSL